MLTTWYVKIPVYTLKETIISSFPVSPTGNAESCINQYRVSFALSSIAPMHFADELSGVPSIYLRIVSFVFPLVFSATPTSDFSVEPMRILSASMYSPFGISLSSRDLFILPAIKFLVIFAILFQPLVHTTQIHKKSTRMNVTNSNLCVTKQSSFLFASTIYYIFLNSKFRTKDFILNICINILFK